MALLVVFVGTGCDKESKETPIENMVNVVENIRFKVEIVEESEEEELSALRSEKVEESSAESFDLGGGVEAIVTVDHIPNKQDCDEKRFITRSLSNNGYTLLAYQGGVLKGSLAGTVSEGQFIPSGSSPSLILPHGIYDFYLYRTDKVSFDQGQHKLIVSRENSAEGFIGWTKTEINQDPDQYVQFTIQRGGARVRIQLEGLMNFSNAITATLTNATGVKVPVSVENGLVTETDQLIYGDISESISFPTTNLGYYETAYQTNSPYLYFLEGTTCDLLKLTFTGGNFYNQSISGKSIVFSNTTQFTRNKTYLIKVKLKFNYVYLFNNGTTGLLKDRGTRTPIGLVVDPSKKLAIFLNHTDAGGINATTVNARAWSTRTEQISTTMSTNLASHIADFNGYDYTWTKTYQASGVGIYGASPRGRRFDHYPAFYYAGKHFDNDISWVSCSNLNGSGTGAFLPTLGEWMLFFKNIGFATGDPTTYSTIGAGISWYPHLVQAAFDNVRTDVPGFQGGIRIVHGTYFWTSSEYSSTDAIYIMATTDGLRVNHIAKNNTSEGIRIQAFVHYP